MKDGAVAAGLAEGCAHSALVAAYLDNELDAASAAGFDEHAGRCAACSSALLEQRRLLCLLDAAFDETYARPLALPRDFTRAVKARAQTDMSGVRDARERVRAVKICAALAASALLLLGAAAFGPLLSAARGAGGVLGVAGRTAADAGAGAGIVLKAVGGRFGAGSGALALILVAVCAGALLLLLRLVSSYHRAGASD
ncbi:MAG TPA: zf-HC2 domain-containing protein [Pyrinomonadaceae bacterium]|nr:zf-HC2 domain-containing protein [Pyrinomonadaceae bacterium]